MWFQIKNNYVAISVYAKPNAQKTALLGIKNDALHLALHARPQEGEANKELLNFIAKMVQVPKTHISILRGKESRHKVLQIPLQESVEYFLKNTCDM